MSTSLVFKCRKCGHTEPFDEAVKAQIIEEYSNARLPGIIQREEVLQKEKEALESKKAQLNALFEEKVGKKVAAFNVKLEQISKENQDLLLKIKSAERTELELRQNNSSLQKSNAIMELEVARKVDEALENYRHEVTDLMEKNHTLELRSKEKSIADLRTIVNELNRKLRHESPQFIGEIGELHVEEILRTEFPTDDFQPVPRGHAGADIIQNVADKRGVCGKIIIEVKRTKNWSNDWIQKVKNDQREAQADLAIIVSEALPDAGKRKFKYESGVWICDLYVFRELIMVLRNELINIHQLNIVRENQNSKAANVYEYVNSSGFHQTVISILDSIKAAKDILNHEREMMTKSWIKREKLLEQIQRASLKVQAEIEVLTNETPSNETPTNEVSGRPDNVA